MKIQATFDLEEQRMALTGLYFVQSHLRQLITKAQGATLRTHHQRLAAVERAIFKLGGHLDQDRYMELAKEAGK